MKLYVKMILEIEYFNLSTVFLNSIIWLEMFNFYDLSSRYLTTRRTKQPITSIVEQTVVRSKFYNI